MGGDPSDIPDYELLNAGAGIVMPVECPMGLMETIRSLLQKRLVPGRECSFWVRHWVDEEMLATGAMGYAIETEAVHEYWNNAYGWKIRNSQIGRQIINQQFARSCGIGIWVPGPGLVVNPFTFTVFNGYPPGPI